MPLFPASTKNVIYQPQKIYLSSIFVQITFIQLCLYGVPCFQSTVNIFISSVAYSCVMLIKGLNLRQFQDLI